MWSRSLEEHGGRGRGTLRRGIVNYSEFPKGWAKETRRLPTDGFLMSIDTLTSHDANQEPEITSGGGRWQGFREGVHDGRWNGFQKHLSLVAQSAMIILIVRWHISNSKESAKSVIPFSSAPFGSLMINLGHTLLFRQLALEVGDAGVEWKIFRVFKWTIDPSPESTNLTTLTVCGLAGVFRVHYGVVSFAF